MGTENKKKKTKKWKKKQTKKNKTKLKSDEEEKGKNGGGRGGITPLQFHLFFYVNFMVGLSAKKQQQSFH